MWYMMREPGEDVITEEGRGTTSERVVTDNVEESDSHVQFIQEPDIEVSLRLL